ncbi:hypothetical protein AB0E83_15795 [Streptomyces sp. NPDC035033]|uniref:hypothetical protein n=1 Tax=Streptomyces sp. NPDC035033 TaxID=3155368 RepID=UPI0033DAB5C5
MALGRAHRLREFHRSAVPFGAAEREVEGEGGPDGMRHSTAGAHRALLAAIEAADPAAAAAAAQPVLDA